MHQFLLIQRQCQHRIDNGIIGLIGNLKNQKISELYYQTYGYNYSDIFLELFIITPSVGPGYNAVVTIRTLPYANCEITVEYLSGPSTADGLDDKISNSSGYVSWTWKVGTRATAGSWPVTVTAHIGGEEITDTWYLTVTQFSG